MKMDFTGDGVDEYVVYYCNRRGTAEYSNALYIVDSKSLELVEVFEKDKAGFDVFTDSQLETVNEIVAEMKQTDSRLDWWNDIDNKYSLLWFAAEPGVKDGKTGIRVIFAVPVENHAPGPMGMFEAFLYYDSESGTFVVEDEIVYSS